MHWTTLKAQDLVYGFWLVVRYGTADSEESAAGFHTMTHYESWVAWRETMSHAGLGLREEPLDKDILDAWDLGSSRNHVSSFIYYTFNIKIFIYHAFGKSRHNIIIWA